MRVVPLVAVLLVASGCGAAADRAGSGGGTVVAGHGLELMLPDGWHGAVTKGGPHEAATLRAATFPVDGVDDLGARARQTMRPDDLLLVVADYGARDAAATPLPLSFTREHVVSFEGFLDPVATMSAVVSGRALQLWLVTARAPTDAHLRRANAVLTTLHVDEPAWQTHRDDAARLSVDVPPSWVVSPSPLTPTLAEPREILAVGTGPLLAGGDRCGHVPERALEALGPNDALVTVVEFREVARHRFPPRPRELRLEDGVEPESVGCLGEPAALDYRLLAFTDAGRSFHVYVALGRDASDARREEARRLLASLRFDPAATTVAFSDPEVGISGEHPRGWHRARALTGFAEPREVLALASYPLRGGAEAGECAPDTAREDIPPDGVFVWLLEYRANIPADRFREPPSAFRLDRNRLGEQLWCFAGPGYEATFSAAGRKLHLLVAFGGPPTDERLREAEAVVNGIEIDPVPVPPPPPWADWPLLPGSAPDSMRAPPGWAAAAANFDPENDPPPRALFFASNRPLPLLPGRLVERARMPSDFPDLVLARGFPDDAVLVWALEESERRPLAGEYPAIDRDWPGRDDFRPAEIATKPAPHVRWLVASGAWMGHRFSVWIARGPDASERDLELALTTARTFAVSGCDRGVGPRCVEPR